ncbi:hypothetical protein [Parasphingopyxis sp.]|uniref:hypothetical protein n=1 Tax=Parasphingopyxis sp. TaxID=1920299 RepID=UPI002638B8C2|nr:hypothetical protein [Parasphingopyxis sp.]
MMKIAHLAIGMALAIGALLPQSAEACVAVTTPGPGTVDYDPTALSPTIRSFQVTVQENCNRGADAGRQPVQIWFTDDIEPQPYGEVGGVPFNINRRARNLLTTPVAPVATPFTFAFTPGSEVLDFEIAFAPGMSATSGIRQISINWSTVDEFGNIITGSLPFPVAIQLRPSFSIRIAGGGRTRDLNFGRLGAGDVRSLDLQARATHPFRIEMDSTYGERLRRARPCGIRVGPPRDAADFINYSASLNGRPISSSTPYIDLSPSGSRTVNFPALPFRVRIDPALDPTSKRAGRYCDVITLSIHPAR